MLCLLVNSIKVSNFPSLLNGPPVSEIFFFLNAKFKFAFFGVCMKYGVMNYCFLTFFSFKTNDESCKEKLTD